MKINAIRGQSLFIMCGLIIYLILLERAKPGPLAAPKLFLSAVLGVVWPCHVALSPPPSPICDVSHCGIENVCPRLDFYLALFRHNNVTNWQECSYITVPTLFSFFCRIIEAPGLLSYRDIIHFVRLWNLTQNLAPSSLQLAVLMSVASTSNTNPSLIINCVIILFSL